MCTILIFLQKSLARVARHAYALHMTETRALYSITDPDREANGDEALPSGEAAGFPGCEAMPMTAAQFERLERHIEYWDTESGVAWMVRETTAAHERPAMRLVALTQRIAQIRGSEIACYGTTSLYDRDAAGAVRVMEADQIIYLNAARANALDSHIDVHGSERPDVVLEVDHTTDARRRKVGLYKQWRIPEIWVEVPDAKAQSRPKSRRSVLTIHALNERTKRYRQAAASTVLRGWTAAEIHTALNERHVSEATWAALHRVGRALGEAEGTVPEDDPFQRAVLQESRARGRAEAEALLARSTADVHRATVSAILADRGIDIPSAFLADLPESQLAACPPGRIAEIALACRDAADFLARLRGEGEA